MFYFIHRGPEFSMFISGMKNVPCTGYTIYLTPPFIP